MERLHSKWLCMMLVCIMVLTTAGLVCAGMGASVSAEDLPMSIAEPVRTDTNPIAYDGTEHTVHFNVDPYIEQGIVAADGTLSATDSGAYTVTFRIVQDGYYWGNNPSDRAPRTVRWNIQKGHIDMSGVTFEDVTVEADGKKHLPEVKGLPENVTVTYSMQPTDKEGTYYVTATFVYEGADADQYLPIDSMTAVLRISPAGTAVEEGESGAGDSMLWLIIVLGVVIVIELIVLASLLRKKKEDKTEDTDPQPQDEQPVADSDESNTDESNMDETQADEVQTEETQPVAQDEQPVQDAQDEQPASVDAESEQTAEDEASEQPREQSDGETKTMSAFLPVALLGAIAPTSKWILIGECVAIGVLAIAIIIAAIKRRKAKEEPQVVARAEEDAIVVDVPEEEPAEEVVEEPVEEVVEEPTEEVVEEQPVVVAEVAAEDDDEEEEEEFDDEEEDEDDDEEIVLREVDEELQYCDVVRYWYTFQARIMQGSMRNKQMYSAVKNAFLAYKNVKSRISQQADTFNSGRTQLAKIKVVGKTLRMYVALDPQEYEFTKYFQKDCSQIKTYEKTPMMIKIKSGRGVRRAIELIEEMAKKYELKPAANPQKVDYAAQLGALPLEDLLAQELVKEIITREEYSKAQKMLARQQLRRVRRKVSTATESNFLLEDDTADLLTEVVEKPVDTSVEETICVDTLSEQFERNELVTLDALKKKGIVDSSVTYLKVTARGSLDKPLRVVANEYTYAATKMILIAGGKVTRIQG